ncbi:MAG: 50S ribosomal protein L17 [Parcubacteria group bacterium GW2011_GWA2_51_10]|nr:MAG: 50S ribosomal protein L17 [Parcubacteria group bacterium GW2011_GWA2_51_10]
MRHFKKIRTLGRKKAGRTALLRNLARSLIRDEGLTTTISRAKELRPLVESLVTKAKQNTIASRRMVSLRLGGASSATKKLHDTLAPRYLSRAGGYTRIVRLGPVGKRAIESARIEFLK